MPDHPEVDLVYEDLPGGRVRPAEAAGDLRLRNSLAAELEGAKNLGRLTAVGDESAAGVAPVADRRLAGKDVPLDRASASTFPVGPMALPLCAGEGGPDREVELLVSVRGVFGPRMAIELVNDGPVTIVLET